MDYTRAPFDTRSDILVKQARTGGMIAPWIGIAGKIASGKSTVGAALAEQFSCPLASFGGILKKYSQIHNLPVDRESLQALGQYLIDSLGEERFMDWAVTNSPDIDWEHPLILEGFRHVGSYRRFVQLYPSALLVYCQVDLEVQIQRLKQRDSLDRTSALLIVQHMTERSVEALEPYARVLNHPAVDISDVVQAVVDLL